jgi:DNA-binding transcriptional ArsR family regulator
VALAWQVGAGTLAVRKGRGTVIGIDTAQGGVDDYEAGAVSAGGDVLRVRFEGDDLARVRLAPTFGPLSETVFSFGAIRARSSDVLLRGWRHGVRDGARAWVQSLSRLSDPLPPVDLHTLAGQSGTFEHAIDGLQRARRGDLESELEISTRIDRRDKRRLPPLPAWLRDLPSDRAAMAFLVEGLRACHSAMVAEHWEGIRAHLDADMLRRGRILAERGVEGLLSTLHPNIAWTGDGLTIFEPASPRDATICSHGRGLLLVPSVFCRDEPRVYLSVADHDAPPVLFYPASLDGQIAASLWHGNGYTPGNRGLEDLIGRTRSAIMEAMRDGATTSELARRVQVSAACASQHASVLRGAGLITTRRLDNRVLHTLTPLGHALLDATPARP